FDLVVERGKHHTAPRGHAQLVQVVFLGLELFGHAALHLAVALYAAQERHALQVALQAVVPLVVRTDEFFLVARALATELHAAMRADVLDDVDAAVQVARHDDRAFADDR